MNIEIITIAVIVSIACALCGVFLVLRRMSLMSDAVSHSILCGVAAGFFISKSFSSAVPFAGAVISGMLSVLLTELLQKTRLIKSDAAIALVFPALFSAGVIMISLYAGNVHLDTDAVLLGEIAFAPFDRLRIFGFSLPRSLVQMGIILLADSVFIILFFKELKITTFDPHIAKALGFSPTKIHYGLMFAVSLTCVGAFDSVGAVLVTALMIAPAASALLLTNDLFVMLILSSLIASAASLSGLFLAVKIDGSIAGAMASMTGVIFLCAYLFSPKEGLIKRRFERKKLKLDFAVKMLTVHLLHHEGTAEMDYECREEHLTEHISWTKTAARMVVSHAEKRGLIRKTNGLLTLSEKGRQTAAKSLTDI